MFSFRTKTIYGKNCKLNHCLKSPFIYDALLKDDEIDESYLNLLVKEDTAMRATCYDGLAT